MTRPEFNLLLTKTPAPSGVSDDFETTRVGDRPISASINGETDTARFVVTDQQAATGKHSLKFADAPGLTQSYYPIMQYAPVARRGVAHGSFSIRMGKDAIFWHEWRDAAKPYKRGPSVRITDNGKLQAGNRDLMSVPLDTWIRLDIVCGLGDKANGPYKLTVTVAGQPSQTFKNLPAGTKDFKTLQWYGFDPIGEKAATIFVDDVKLEVKEP